MAKKSERSLYYYDLHWLNFNEETKALDEDEKSSAKFKKFFSEIYNKQIESEDIEDQIWENENNDNIFVIVDNIQEQYIEFRIVLCRTDILPYIEKGGKLESLGEYIDEDQTIAEITHCVLFPDYNILGAEFNFSGARASSIAGYITYMESDVTVVNCKPKLNMDVYAKLINKCEYTLFDLAVKSNSKAYANVLNQKSVFSTILAEVPDTDVFEIVLKKRKTKKNQYKGFTGPLSNDEIKELITKYREDIKTFVISKSAYKDGVDLLSDKLVKKVTLVKVNKRAIDSTKLYDDIKTFFNDEVIKHCNKK